MGVVPDLAVRFGAPNASGVGGIVYGGCGAGKEVAHQDPRVEHIS